VLTVILVVVALVLHFKVPLHPVAVKVAVSGPHKLVLLLAIDGVVGILPVVMTIAFEVPLVPQLFVQVAV
jgi:hypothetical protein